MSESLRPDTVADLHAHARRLAALAEAEGEPSHARRALVTLAVAGTGGDREAFTVAAGEVIRAFARIGLDPVAVFDAASALADDAVAREVLVMLPRTDAARIRDELVSRITRS